MSRNTSRFAAGLLVLVMPLVAAAQDEPEPRARARVDVEGPVTVGQPVRIVVEVLVPSYFTGAPRFPELDIAGALTIFEPRGANFTEREGRTTWAGQRRSYTVYPQRAGQYDVDGITVDVAYFAAGRGRITASVSTDAVRFSAEVPAEAEGLGYFIATTGLALEQSLEPQPETLQVGEAFTRQITVTVQNAFAMVIPPLGLAGLDGLAAYPEPPVVADEGGERGEAISGRRVETVTYVAREAGSYALPPVELAWWDVGAGALRRATVPAVVFQVLPGEASVEFALGSDDDEEAEAAGQGDESEQFSLSALLRRWAVPPAVVLCVGLVLRRAARATGFSFGQMKARWQAREQSEGAYFRRFRRAASSGDPRATARTLAAWLDRRHTGPGAATFRAFAANAADPELAREAAKLDAALFVANPTPGSWSGRPLAERVGRARRRRAGRGGLASRLAPLNPRQVASV